MCKYVYLSGLFISTCLLCLTAVSTQSSPPAPIHSPEAHTDLICHTSYASECYPAIFQPTEYFQLIHDDQSIPPGLHVRLDLTTGLKEARLNVAESDDAPKAEIVLIDSPPTSAIEEQLVPEVPDQKDSTLKEQGDNIGEDVLSNENDEINDFMHYRRDIVGLLRSPPTNHDGKDILESTNALIELAHAQEWGLAITSDSILVDVLVKAINPKSNAPIEIQSAAAQLLGTCIQNNPDALEALFANYARHDRPTPQDVTHAALDETTARDPRRENTLLQQRLLFFLSQLCQSQKQLEIFVGRSGLSTLLPIYDTERMELDDGRYKVRAKVANFFIDHVLPTMINWEGGSLLRETPPGVSISMTGSTSTWMNAMRNIEPWCHAFRRQIMLFEEVDGFINSGIEESTLIAFDMLDNALKSHGSSGGCKSIVEKQSTHPQNEEL